MRFNGDDLSRLMIISLMSSTPIALMTFDFMFPNLTTPSFSKNLLEMFLISILAGFPGGYLLKRSDLAMVSVILHVMIGYLIAVVMYSTPYTLYNIELILPDFYYALFFRYTIVLLFIFILGGFIGSTFGQIMKDSIRKEATSLIFPEKEE